MIALLVLLGFCFAWGCIATAVAVAWCQAADMWKRVSKETDEERRDLMLQLQSRSVGEYAGARIAMQPWPDQPHRDYTYDDTGLIRMPAEPLDTE